VAGAGAGAGGGDADGLGIAVPVCLFLGVGEASDRGKCSLLEELESVEAQEQKGESCARAFLWSGHGAGRGEVT
jgi:hypothetical protein